MTSPGWVEDPRADLDRIPRQQYFLRTVSEAAIKKTGDNPLKIDGLFNAVVENFAHDQNLKLGELKALTRIFKGLNPTKVDMMTLPVEEASYAGYAGKVIAKYPDAQPVITRLANFPTPKRAIPKPLPASKVEVRVVNGSGVQGAAGRAADEFAAAGFRSAGPPADADRDDYDKTQIRYAPGKALAGYTVAFALGTNNQVEAASTKDALDADVLVIVGKDYLELKRNFDALAKLNKTPSSTRAKPPASATGATTTTTTTIPQPTVDTRFVPVDPETGGTLVGCPKK
jgi:hypothetical protein